MHRGEICLVDLGAHSYTVIRIFSARNALAEFEGRGVADDLPPVAGLGDHRLLPEVRAHRKQAEFLEKFVRFLVNPLNGVTLICINNLTNYASFILLWGCYLCKKCARGVERRRVREWFRDTVDSSPFLNLEGILRLF